LSAKKSDLFFWVERVQRDLDATKRDEGREGRGRWRQKGLGQKDGQRRQGGGATASLSASHGQLKEGEDGKATTRQNGSRTVLKARDE